MKDRKMSLLEYSLLSEIEQYEMVYIEGAFLDFQLAPPNTRFTLYALNMFFVEVEHNLLTKKMVGNKAFIYDETIEKYVTGNINP